MKGFSLAAAFVASCWSRKAPLVFAPECDRLTSHLADVSIGRRFLLMTNMTGTTIRDDLRLLFQMTLPLTFTTKRQIIQLDTTFSQQLSQEKKLVIGGHDDVVQKMNLVRGFLQGGMGDITHYDDWMIRSDRHYRNMHERIGEQVSFLEALRIQTPVQIDDYYIGHEARVLPYERDMTRNDSLSGKEYACSSHFLWVKDDECQEVLDYLRTIENPLGIIVQSQCSFQRLVNMMSHLNPKNQEGKITLFVEKMTGTTLSRLVDVVKGDQLNVVWCCSDMDFLTEFMKIHRNKKTQVGGVFVRHDADALRVLRILSQTWEKKLMVRQPWHRFSLS